MGLIDNKIQKALKPATDKIEELILKAQKENKALMIKEVHKMASTLDELVEQKVSERLKMLGVSESQID